MADSPICEYEGCDNPAKKRGYCLKHYSKLKRARQLGEPLGHGKCKAWLERHKDFEGDDCLIWPFSRRAHGYGVLNLGEIRTGAHRHMCFLAHGKPSSSDLMAAHSCGNGHLGCVNPRHLRWATAKENHKDMVKHGTAVYAHPCKLTDDEIRLIRSLKDQVPQVEIAKTFGVHRATISRIHAFKHRADVSANL